MNFRRFYCRFESQLAIVTHDKNHPFSITLPAAGGCLLKFIELIANRPVYPWPRSALLRSCFGKQLACHWSGTPKLP